MKIDHPGDGKARTIATAHRLAMRNARREANATHWLSRLHFAGKCFRIGLEATRFMSLARDVTTVGTATLLSRLLGFFRDVGIAAVLGAGVLSDAYFAALQIPNLFRRLLAEGALNSAL